MCIDFNVLDNSFGLLFLLRAEIIMVPCGSHGVKFLLLTESSFQYIGPVIWNSFPLSGMKKMVSAVGK